MADRQGVSPLTLSDEQFLKICGLLQVHPLPGASRVEVRKPIMMAIAEKGELRPPMLSQFRDLSIRGATLTHETPIEMGTQIVFFVKTTRLVMQVNNVKLFSDGTAMMGATFLGVLEPRAGRVAPSAA